MAVKSMTGFGAGSARSAGVRVAIELSSVNRKQLDVVLRLPSSLAAFESRVQKMVADYISRGRISGSVQIETGSGATQVAVDQQRAKAVVDELRGTAKKLKLTDDLNASMLLQIPGLLQAQAMEQDPDILFSTLEKALHTALKKLNAMRAREGKELVADLLARLDILEGILVAVKTFAPQVVSAYRERLLQALESVSPDAAADERILKEIALFGERSDISEEITRIASHIGQFKKLLRGQDPAGRTLDFLSQELLREINTIGSKANGLNITEQVILFKTELERIREQIQNVE